MGRCSNCQGDFFAFGINTLWKNTGRRRACVCHVTQLRSGIPEFPRDPTKMYPVFRVFLLIYQSFSLEKRLGSQGSQKLSSLPYTILYTICHNTYVYTYKEKWEPWEPCLFLDVLCSFIRLFKSKMGSQTLGTQGNPGILPPCIAT